jgi:hypothetical protein
MKPISTALLGALGLAILLAPRWGTAQTPQLDDRTIQDRLAKHADLFKVGGPRWVRLEDMKPNAQGVIDYQRSVIYDYMRYDPPLTPEQELAQMAKGADAVVSGPAVGRYSAANPLHTALYSDWVVSVTKVYKNSSTIGVQAGSEITVTRIGGDLALNGHRVIYRDSAFPDFAMNHTYVFYLRAHPDSSSFGAISGGTFDLTGTTPALLADPRNPTGMRAFSQSSTTEFLAAVERSTIQ